MKIPGTPLKVENIFCIGRNYAEHAIELGNPIPTEPVVFLKPTSSICYSEGKLRLPKQSSRVDHEVEIVVAIGKSGRDLDEKSALGVLDSIGVGIDFTARDLQDKAKEKALPWAVSKGFDSFAAISSFVTCPKDAAKLANLHFTLHVNGVLKQTGHTAEMLNSIPRIVSYLSGIFTLSPGDLIFTGTPKGVAPLSAGDEMIARLEDWCELKIIATPRSNE
jgi:2-keto-4-pentenoate hydratase/2-oxohepta-3-ene-1,7-dioic acid hydratase in catechol pathway